ncbi:MAG: phosphate ABC transporter permease PstA [Myxococcota bacterium]|nr:phosphate ABC transporter permease PstA [Myxococcota bacterium]
MSEGNLHLSERAARNLRKRHRAERRFRAYGMTAVALAMVTLVLLLGSILWRGWPGFFQHTVLLDVALDPEVIDPEGSRNPDRLAQADFLGLLKTSLREQFPEATSRRERRELTRIVSAGADLEIRRLVLESPGRIGERVGIEVLLSDDADLYFKGQLDPSEDGATGRLSSRQAGWLDSLEAEGRVENRFHTRFFQAGDSREPELAGIGGAAVGSLLTLAITLLLSFPVGVAAAVYLEEFAPKGRWTDFIEVNINNLAAVPSIVFGLLGLAVFLNFFGLPRSAPVVGGLVLSLMTLPTIIIASRSSIAAVPPSIREAALGVGASKHQVVLHHVLPLALPGILTGTIIGMSRALGETAPLLMIGMVAFIVDVPTGFTSPSTLLPVQVFLWADSPERAFVAKTSAAIVVLLTFLVAMNLAAVLLRSRFEQRW